MSETAQLTPPPQSKRASSGLLVAWIAIIISIISVAITAYVWVQSDIAIGQANKTAQKTHDLETEIATLESRLESLGARQEQHSSKLQGQQSALQSQQAVISNLSASPQSAPGASGGAAATGKGTPAKHEKTSAKDALSTADSMQNPSHQSNQFDGQLAEKVTANSQQMQALKARLQQQQQALAQQSDTIVKQQQRLNQQSLSLRKQSLSLQNTRQEIRAFANHKNSSRRQMLLAEAEYLVRLAQLQLNINQNTQAALQLLQTADQDLAALKDASLQTVRMQINHDIQVLKDIKPVAVDHIITRLNQVSDQVSALRLSVKMHFTHDSAPDKNTNNQRSVAANDKSATAANDAKSQTQADTAPATGYQAAIAGLKNLVIIKKITASPQPVFSADEISYLKENIRLKITQAEWAVMHKNQKLYRQKISQALSLLENDMIKLQATEKTKASIAEIKQRLLQLRGHVVAINLPKLYTSAASLRAMLTGNQLTNTGRTPHTAHTTMPGSSNDAANLQPAATEQTPSAATAGVDHVGQRQLQNSPATETADKAASAASTSEQRAPKSWGQPRSTAPEQ